MACPQCGGSIVARTTKKGRRFYGCTNYPDCNFVSWVKPVPKNCPDGGAFLVEKRSKARGLYYQCSREGCEYTEAAAEEE